MYDAASGILLRRYREGDAAIPGFLDDYAMFAQALLDLYEAQFDLRHLELAVRLTEKQRELFEDTEPGGFFSTAAGDHRLVLRVKEDYDGAEPSGNSVAVMNLLRLAQMTNRAGFPRVGGAHAGRLRQPPSAGARGHAADAGGLRVPARRAARDHPGGPARQRGDAGAARASCTPALCPAASCCWWIRAEARQALAAGIPAIESMNPLDGRASGVRLPQLHLPVAGFRTGQVRRVATILNSPTS